MEAHKIKPYGIEVCPFCKKQIYLEEVTENNGKPIFAVWCPTKGCIGNEDGGVFRQTQEEAYGDYKCRTDSCGDW